MCKISGFHQKLISLPTGRSRRQRKGGPVMPSPLSGCRRSLSLRQSRRSRQGDCLLLTVTEVTVQMTSFTNAIKTMSNCFSYRHTPLTSFNLLMSRFFRRLKRIIVKPFPSTLTSKTQRHTARWSSSVAITKPGSSA